MTTLRSRRPERAPTGAFGRKPVYLPTQVEIDDERAERDRERRRIRDILVVEYSWDELQQISANMRADAERSQEIADMFAELGGRGWLEGALYSAHQRSGEHRRRAAAVTRILQPRAYRRALERVREWHARVKANNPQRYDELREQSRARRARWIELPGKRQQHRAVSTAGKRRRRRDPVRGAELRKAEADRMRAYRRAHPKANKRVRCDDVLAKTMAHAARVQLVTQAELVTAIGCAPASARTALSKLAATGELRKVRHGVYQRKAA